MIIGLHSFKGGSGKSFIALNLGYLISREKKVCVVEMDLRAPSFHTFFKCKKYINSLLRKDDDITDYLVNPKENLYIIPASPSIEDIRRDLIREDVKSIKMLERLQEIILKLLKMDFEYVIIDNPPGLGYMSINSMIVSDMILFISRPEKADIDGLKILFNISKNINKPKYVVLNRVNKDVKLDFPVIVKIPCSCDVSMDYPFFVELNEDHEVSESLKELSKYILKKKVE